MAKKRRPLPEITEIFKALHGETERGCVLVGAAWVEDRLRLIIKQALHVVPPSLQDYREDLIDTLLTDQIGLGSTKTRLLFCRANQLIDDGTHDSIQHLSRLRNQFAHWAGPAQLLDLHIRTELQQFLNSVDLSSYKVSYAGVELPAFMGDDFESNETLRRKFEACVITVVQKLVNDQHQIAKISLKKLAGPEFLPGLEKVIIPEENPRTPQPRRRKRR